MTNVTLYDIDAEKLERISERTGYSIADVVEAILELATEDEIVSEIGGERA